MAKTANREEIEDVSSGDIHMTNDQIDKEISLDHDLLLVGHQVIERQKAEGFLKAWKNNWRAAGWSLFISMALWMEGFDQAIVSRGCRRAATRADTQ